MAPARQRIAGLDGLRAIAVMMVFVDHRLPGANGHFLGGYGVHIFFVLSGFLIVGGLHRDQVAIARQRLSALSAWTAFMTRRAARIFPAYFLLLAVLILLSLSGIGPYFEPGDALAHALFITNIYFIETNHWGSFSQAWSLAIEEQFYLLSAPLLLLIPPRATWRVCLGVVLCGTFWNFWLSLFAARSMAPGLDSLSSFGLIALGGMLAVQDRPSSSSLSAKIQVILLTGLSAIPFIPDGASNPIIRQVAQPLLAALLLAEIRDHQATWLVNALETKAIVYLGKISYGFYLIHQLVTPAFLRWTTGGCIDITTWSPVEQIVPLLLISIGVAACSWHWIEQPIIQRAKRWLTISATLENSNLNDRFDVGDSVVSTR